MELIQNLEQLYKDGWLIKQTHKSLPLTIWNYSVKTTFNGYWNEFTTICRGLVTDNETGEIVARPLPKFWNWEENKHTPTETFEIYDKLDGSLGISFYYKDQWVFASRGSFESEQAMKGGEMFRKLPTIYLHKDCTYCWEIIYPENRIVVNYDDEKLVMLYCCNTEDNIEFDIKFFKPYGFKLVDRYPYQNPDLKTLKEFNIPNHEGYVIKFTNGQRCKIKFEDYIRLHHIMTDISTTSVWECLKNGQDIEEILKDVPDEFFKKIKVYRGDLLREFNNFKIEVNAEYKVINLSLGNCDDKTYALFIKDNYYKSYLFSLRKGKSIDEAIWNKIKPKFMKL